MSKGDSQNGKREREKKHLIASERKGKERKDVTVLPGSNS